MTLRIIAGGANPALALKVADALGTGLVGAGIVRFPDGEIHVELAESVRGGDVYLLQPTTPPIAEHLHELLFLADAARRAGARRVTAVVPYFAYARQDRRATGREAVGGRVVADLLAAAHVDRVVAVDLHETALEGFFPCPLEHLTSVPALADTLGVLAPDGEVVVAPDAGATKLAERYGRCLKLPVAFVHKRRVSGESVTTHGIAGDVRGRRALIVDDMISTAGTVAGAVGVLLEAGAAPDIVVAATHGLFVGPAVERLAPLPIARLVVTDTVGRELPSPLPGHVVSVAPLLATAIGCLHEERSLDRLILHA